LTDGQGTTVDFRNTLIIMTSNLGSQIIKDLSQNYGAMEKKSGRSSKIISNQNF